MTHLSEARGLGAAGSVLILMGFLPPFTLVALIGFVLILVSGKYFVHDTGDRDIDSNITISVLLAVVGTVVGLLVVFSGIYSLGGTISTGTIGNGFYAYFTEAAIAGLVIIWLFYTGSAYFLRKAYNSIADSLGAELFRTAALVILMGAALTIVLGLGLIIIFIGASLQLAAFLSLPDEKPLPTPMDEFGRPLRPAPRQRVR